MRRIFLFALLLAATPLGAQEAMVHRANLPERLEDRVLDMYRDRSATRYHDGGLIGADEVVRGDVVATGGSLHIQGDVRGSVAMMNGDVIVDRGGVVDGDVIVVGGVLRLEEDAVVSGAMWEFGEESNRLRAADRPGPDDGRDSDPWTIWANDGDGFSRLRMSFGPGPNRTEGVPITFGPLIQTQGRNPLRVSAQAIWRTQGSEAFGTDPWGYRASIRQFFDWGPVFQVGASAYSTVDAINRWELDDVETGIATLAFHEDYRDHFAREGWSAFVGVRPVSELDMSVEYRQATHASVGVASPWTLFNQSAAWRYQPTVAEGTVSSVAGRLELDLRRDRRATTSGWFVAARMEHGLHGTLTRPGLTPGSAGLPALQAQTYAPDFTTFFVDLRRYEPVSSTAGLRLRAVAGGNVREEALPPQFQQALGGPGTLPGYAPFEADCGARNSVGFRDGTAFFPGFGCDRFALGQAEYQGRFDFGWGYDGDDDAPRKDHSWRKHAWDVDARWILFLDAGQGWSYGAGASPTVGTTGLLVDGGMGFLLDDLGVYVALPLQSDMSQRREPRLFLRLQPRF